MKIEKLAQPWDGRPLQPKAKGWHLLRYLLDGRVVLFTAQWDPALDCYEHQGKAACTRHRLTPHGMVALGVLYRGPLNTGEWEGAQVLPPWVIQTALDAPPPPPPPASATVSLEEYRRQVMSVAEWARRALLAEEGLKAAAQEAATFPDEYFQRLNNAASDAQRRLLEKWAEAKP